MKVLDLARKDIMFCLHCETVLCSVLREEVFNGKKLENFTPDLQELKGFVVSELRGVGNDEYLFRAFIIAILEELEFKSQYFQERTKESFLFFKNIIFSVFNYVII